MKVTNEERFTFGILQVALIVRDTLEYFIPTQNPNGYPVAVYQNRKTIIERMTGEGSPFYSFCRQNGLGTVKDNEGKDVPARGQRLLNSVQRFVKECYSADSRFLRVLDDKLVVDPSFFVPVMEEILGIRESLNDVLTVVLNSIKQARPDELDPDFVKMLTVEQRYSRAVELRLVAMQMNTTFQRFQRAVRNYLNTLRTSTTTDPTKDPDFKVTDDPEVAFDNNEMGKLFGFMNFVIAHSHETDDEFKNACEEMKKQSRSFIGDPKITNIEEFAKTFAAIFIPLINSSAAEFRPLFDEVFKSIRDFEIELVKQRGGNAAPAAEHAPTTDMEAAQQTLTSADMSKEAPATEETQTPTENK